MPEPTPKYPLRAEGQRYRDLARVFENAAIQAHIDLKAARSAKVDEIEALTKMIANLNRRISETQAPWASNERLKLAKLAVIDIGYFTPEQVGDDLAPRIHEYASYVKERVEVMQWYLEQFANNLGLPPVNAPTKHVHFPNSDGYCIDCHQEVVVQPHA